MRTVWTLLALIPILLGLSAIAGWIAHIPMLTQVHPGFTPLVFNGAICFIMTGLALFFLFHPFYGTRPAQIVLGSLIFIIGALTAIEVIFNIDLHIDEIFLQAWMPMADAPPGRMALNTTFSFMLSGLILILLSFSRIKILAMCIEIFIFILFLIGVLGLAGYILKIEFLYNWYSYTQMSLQSAICFTAISVCFWSYWRTNESSAGLYEGRQDTKILLLSTAILLCVALIVGLASFVTIAKQQATKTGESFQQILEDKSSLFENEINHVFQVLNVIRVNSIFQKDLLSQGDSNQAENYKDVLNLFLAEGFSAVKINDRFGNTLASLGNFIEKPVFFARLNTSEAPSNLLWKDGWYIQVMVAVSPSLSNSGMIVAEWPLYNIDMGIASNQLIGKTGSFIVCTSTGDKEQSCYSSRLGDVFHTTKAMSTQFLPADYALAGQSGVITSYTYQQKRLLAAYGPVDHLGLGMIVDMETSEIYEPIKENLHYILPFIVIAIVIGLLLLRLQVIPLVRRVVKAEQELLRTNRRLQESEERYALAVRGSHVGLWDWKVGTDQVFYSPYYKTMLGYAEHEVPPKLDFFKMALHPDDYDRTFEAIKEHLEHYAPFDIEFRLKQKSGEYHWYRSVGEALRDDQGVAVRMAGSHTDIGERKKAEQRLSAQYAVIKILSEAPNVESCGNKVIQAICELLEWDVGVMWMADYQIRKMRCVGFWCQSTLSGEAYKNAMLQTEVQIGVGLPGRVWNSAQPAYIFDIVVDRNFPAAAKDLGLHSALCFPILLQNKVLGVVEFLTQKKQIPDDSLIKMMAAIGAQIAQFIQRKSTEVALRESEGYKTAIVESASDSIMTIDEKGMIVSFNPLTSEIFGYAASELNNKNIDLLIPGLTEKLKQFPEKMVLESEGVRKSREGFPIEISASIMHLNKQDVSVTIVRDITERKKVEKLKNEFISVVSHELRTPLTSIRGALGLIVGGMVDQAPEKMAKLLSIANHNSDRLLLLINDILDMEKIESGKMRFHLEVLDINKIVKAAIHANKMYAEKFETQLQFSPGATDAMVNVDPDRLVQVLTNLISNAVKFSPKNEAVIVKTMVIDDRVRVSVSDKGAGIPSEFQAKIFQKFSQADSSASREKGGTGLGLSISKSIIEKLGGLLGFTSMEGHGAIFYFDLPLWYPNKADSPLSVKASETKVKQRYPHVLLVEDDIATNNVVKTLLQGRAKVTTVDTIQSTLDKIHNGKFDLAILDLLLPDGNGVSLLPEFLNHSIPVIVFSAIELGQDYSQYVRRALIKTETSNQELLEVINHILEEME
ncbi:MAG: PAS domain S-box protein [Gammaproteobacteria bacterium]|nr:PAS domain S-box protein [Gammaproteobacteria bacterium]